MIATMLVFGYVLNLVPSTFHASLMERLYKKGMLVSQFRTVGCSALSGLLAGCILCVGIVALTCESQNLWKDFADNLAYFSYLLPWGLVTGGVVGLILLGIERCGSRNVRRVKVDL
jgi:hypothetical protein